MEFDFVIYLRDRMIRDQKIYIDAVLKGLEMSQYHRNLGAINALHQYIDNLGHIFSEYKDLKDKI